MSIFLIAEIGINHNGDLKIAKQMINYAKEAGFDAVKFQKRSVEEVYAKEFLDSPRESPWGKTQREQKMGLEFTEKNYDEIAEEEREAFENSKTDKELYVNFDENSNLKRLLSESFPNKKVSVTDNKDGSQTILIY